MDCFPLDFEGELKGLTFDEVLTDHPRWIEFVRTCWTNDCTGVFLDFLKYVRMKMMDATTRREHESRCVEYVYKLLTTDKESQIPTYLKKYQ